MPLLTLCVHPCVCLATLRRVARAPRAAIITAENDSHEGKRKAEGTWPIFRIHHQRSRYVYDMFYRKKEISRELYEWLLREVRHTPPARRFSPRRPDTPAPFAPRQGYADPNLIAKWKKPGYERLCCLRCIQTKDTNYGTACICRVPKDKLAAGKVVECVHCGCRGCVSGEGGAGPKRSEGAAAGGAAAGDGDA